MAMEETPKHFFKVILVSTLEEKKLRILEKFVRIFGNELSTVTLTIPNGQVWEVGLIRDGRSIWFHNGWHDFIQYNSISVGYFLVFKYGGNSNFNVLIFDPTTCEIEYPYYGKEPENDRHNLSRQDESENEDSIERIYVTTPNPTFESPKNKAFDKCPRSSSLKPSQLNRAKPSFVLALGVDKNQERGYESQSKRRKKEELVGSNQSDAVGSDINLKKTAYEVGTHSSDDAAKFDGDELEDLLDNMGICVHNRFGNIAFEERERVIAAARLFKPKNPSFMVIWRSSQNYHLYVPAKFARKYFSTSTKSIKVLDSDGRKWSALLTSWPMYITKFGGFGKKFDGGDICVFELISRKILKLLVLKIRDVVKEGGSKQTSNVIVEEVAANNRKNEDQKKSSENEGGYKKRVVVKKGVSKDTRNVMVAEAAAINEEMEEKPQHFFKVILASTLEEKKLRISKKFVRKFRDELSAFATITTPDSRVWRVGLSKDERMIWFDDGWQDFMEYYSIRVGYFLVFEYEKRSNFHVIIFDTSTFEVSYPYNFEEMPSKNRKMGQVKTDTADNGEDEHPTQITDLQKLRALLEDKKIFISRNYTFSSTKERDRLFTLTGSLKRRKPSFMIVLLPSHLYGHTVYLPAKFTNKYLTRDAKCIKVRAFMGREWPVRISWKNGMCNAQRGWTKFLNDMKLKAGDICVFELIRTEDLLLEVSVFKESGKVI